MDRERQRLARLEEEALKSRLAPTGRTWPRAEEEERASRQGDEAWWELMRAHGWTRETLEAEIERINTVHERCFESGYEDWQIVGAMAAFLDAGGDLDHYPGPRPYWGTLGGAVR